MKKFKKAYVEITNVCNLSCSFCPKTTRKSRFMTCDELENILSQIDDLTDFIYFHLMGEPLLHPDLEKLLYIAYKYNKKVILTTNGTLIRKVSDILINAKALHKVVFSLHSFEANDSEISMIDYLENIFGFCKKASSETEIITSLRLWNEDNNSIIGKNLLNSSIFDIISKEFFYENLVENLNIQQRGIKLQKNIYLGKSHCFEWPDKNKSKISDKAFCYGLRDHFAIQCDGMVVPCCLDNNGEIKLGNCFEKDIHEILNSPRARAIYNGFSNRKAVEDLCTKCEFVTRFSD